MKRGFGSDNHSGVHPDVLKAIAEVNVDHAMAYGEDEYSAKVEQLFKQYFGNDFILYTTDAFINEGYLGPFGEHPRLRELLGDYFACAIGKVNLIAGDVKFVGQHAGLTEDEMMIPLIVYQKGEVK